MLTSCARLSVPPPDRRHSNTIPPLHPPLPPANFFSSGHVLQHVYSVERSKRELGSEERHARRVASREDERAAAVAAGTALPPRVLPRRPQPDARKIRGLLRCANASCARRSNCHRKPARP